MTAPKARHRRKAEIRRALVELRGAVDGSEDAYVQRIAYAMETAIRWATEETCEWSEPAEDAVAFAANLREELSR